MQSADEKKLEAESQAAWKVANDINAKPQEQISAARKLMNDFPTHPDGYYVMMHLIEYYQNQPEVADSRVLAKEMADGSGPEEFKLWAKGFLTRPKMGQRVSMQFTAVDGREVDISKMKGRVVLIDFWATDCPGCVAAMPQLKALYDKYHSRGLEIVGVDGDDNKTTLLRFINEKQIPWPQYFAGKAEPADKNKFFQQFGIDGIPHVLFVDKNNRLNGEDVGMVDYEGNVTNLLARP